MTKDNDFLKSLIVDKETIQRTNTLSRFAGKRAYYISHYKNAYLKHLKDEYNKLHKMFPNVEIVPEARIKGQKSYTDKVKRVVNEDPNKDIYDIFANRYIVLSVNGSNSDKDIVPILYQIRDYLAYSNPNNEIMPERTKDYIVNPKHSTYQSLHLTRLHHDTPYEPYQSETQLRSYFMHSNAHSGRASHANTYKERIPGKTPLPNLLEYVFDENGACVEVKEKSYEKAFEDFFGIPYDPRLFSSFKEK